MKTPGGFLPLDGIEKFVRRLEIQGVRRLQPAHDIRLLRQVERRKRVTWL